MSEEETMHPPDGDGSDERKFLHDLAGPIGTAIFVLDSVVEDMQSRSNVDAGDLMQMQEIYEALERVKKLLHDRREILIQRGVPSAKP